MIIHFTSAFLFYVCHQPPKKLLDYMQENTPRVSTEVIEILFLVCMVCVHKVKCAGCCTSLRLLKNIFLE